MKGNIRGKKVVKDCELLERGKERRKYHRVRATTEDD